MRQEQDAISGPVDALLAMQRGITGSRDARLGSREPGGPRGRWRPGELRTASAIRAVTIWGGQNGVSQPGDEDLEVQKVVSEAGDEDLGVQKVVSEAGDEDLEVQKVVSEAGDEDLEVQKVVSRVGDADLERQEAISRAGDTDLERQEAISRLGDADLERQKPISRLGDADLERQKPISRLADADLAWPERDHPRCPWRSGLPRWARPFRQVRSGTRRSRSRREPMRDVGDRDGHHIWPAETQKYSWWQPE
jgi:hypothetical protein